MERAGRSGRTRTKNGGRERPVQARRAAEDKEEKAYAGRVCIGVLGVLCGGGSQ